MKTVTFFICLMGSAFAIPTYPLMYKLGIRGQKNSEKINFRFMPDNFQAATVSEKQDTEKTFAARQIIAVPILGDSLVASKYTTFIADQFPYNGSQLQVRDTSSESSKKKNTESEQYMNSNDDLLSVQSSSDREEQALMMDDEDKDEHRNTNSQERNSSEHQVKRSLGRINFLAQNMGVMLASDKQESVFERSSSHQSNREHQFKNDIKKSNMASDDQDDQENPGQGLTVSQEQDTWKYNKNPVVLFENNSEGDEEEEEEEKEEKTEEWDETGYRDKRQKAHVKIQEDLYRSEQNEDSSQSDEMLRDANQPLQIIKRQDAEFEEADQKEEDEEEENNTPTQSHKGEEVTISPKSTEQDQNAEWQSQEDEDRFQDNTQIISDHEEVVKRQNLKKAAAYMEASNVEDNSHDNNDDDSNNDADSEEDDFNKSQKEAAYHKGEQIQSNDHRSISSEEQGEGKDEDESMVMNETEDDQNINIKHLIHFEQDYYSHEPTISDHEEHEKITSLVQRSVNTMEPEDNVKMTGSSYNEDGSSSDSRLKVLLSWSDIFLDPCRNFHCKRGKVCQADEQEKLSCVCQDPAACPPTNDHEHVCGTDNKTYDGTCQLFGTKCKLEGTKMGHQLHLDYMGYCKYIPPCTDYEVDQFPLRMRDWLKNILMQLYERDLDRSGFLSDKQRSKVKKIYQNEKRLMAGDHPVELLLHDFEKNYHMYVYPVHWQFSQLDRHPGDRLLTHSELAPLRASLVPMEHCITRFFQECDADRNKHVSLKEWCHCFGIKEEDTDENLLF
ncbi:SPARC-like protein 1 isoform X1 [Malaclemys terrapin pileata]|uniref:SPARC-like protein 1 isoform X1 n=1 Tax=Malaclemys terrapin pileata TaxID=2991368 RepID=UPI0023A8207B|nr:SPARC-like protein 1 isoform X1 [Malaclemys terrapin pileata]